MVFLYESSLDDSNMNWNKKLLAKRLCALLVGFTMVGKMFKIPPIVEQMENLGLTEELLLLAGIELVALIFYLIPKTFRLGFFLLTAYYGGAIAVNLNSPEDTIPAIGFLILIWVLTWISSPDLFFPELNRTKD